MDAQTIIFYGKSGAGKGTQAKLLESYFQTNDPARHTLYIETGARFRAFMEENNLTAKMVKQALDEGSLLPEFLPVWVWTDFFIKNYTGTEHIVLDGLARRPFEVDVLHHALEFYKRNSIKIIVISVSDDWAAARLKGRGRYDDDDVEIKKRLAWFNENVTSSIEEWKKFTDTAIFQINGEQTIEQVHADVLGALSLS